MNKWKKRIGQVHLMSKNTTRCGIPMLGNNYAKDSDKIECLTCVMFNNLDKINENSVTDYYSALYKSAILKLGNLSTSELEEFLNYSRCVD